MPIYLGDYLSDTTHFRTIDHGAYLLLLLSYWRQQGPLPGDVDQLMAITRTSRADWRTIQPRVARLFQISATHWTHLAMEREITKTQDLILKRSKAGKAGMAARYSTSPGNLRTPESSQP